MGGENTKLEIQLAKFEVHLDVLKAYAAQMPAQITALEGKIDNLTKILSNDYLRKEDFNTRLNESKSNLLSIQNIIFSLVILLLSVVLNVGISKI